VIFAKSTDGVSTSIDVHQLFGIEVNFSDPGILIHRSCKCHCCEYRQYAQADYVNLVDKKTYPIWNRDTGGSYPLVGSGQYVEDTVLSLNFAFGHRNGNPKDPNGGYLDDSGKTDNANGCHYKSGDYPGISGYSGPDPIELHYHFKGQIIDVCNNNKVEKEKQWDIVLSVPVP
jgi:hypothetical protein